MDRIILHIDMNSYFASVEQQANPFLRGKPIGVTGKRFDTNESEKAQRSIIATASIEAKRLGVKTAMSTWEAKRILPSLIIVPGDPEKYSEITHRFNNIFHRYTDQVEVFSVDESFLDLTDTAQDYFEATMIAQRIREEIKEECGERITCSIGVAPNKLVAKLASESCKPNGLTVVRGDQVDAFVLSQELGAFCGLGRQTEKRLAGMGIKTVAELRECSKSELTSVFKSYGLWLWQMARGIDHDPVSEIEALPKSVGHSYTLPHDTDDPKEIKKQLLGLADKVGWRLRRDGFVASCVTVFLRFKDFEHVSRQYVFSEPTADGKALTEIAWTLIKNNIHAPVRLVGISASHLALKKEQGGLFLVRRRLLQVIEALDRIQARFGSKSWTRASLIDVEFKPRSSGWHYDHEL